MHDFIYRTHPDGWTKESADKEFYYLLIQQGIPYLSAYLAYLGVKLFGGPAWSAGGKETK